MERMSEVEEKMLQITLDAWKRSRESQAVEMLREVLERLDRLEKAVERLSGGSE